MKNAKFLIFLLIFSISSCKTLSQSDKKEIREEARQRRIDKNRV